MRQSSEKQKRFLANTKGDASMQFALIAGAVSIATALMVPLVFKGNFKFASTNVHGIDTTVTGSIKPVKRYHIRKSVLDQSN